MEKIMQKYKSLNKNELIKVAEILADAFDQVQATTAKHISTKYRKGKSKSAVHIKNLSYHFIPHGSRLVASLLLKARNVLELTKKPNTWPFYSFLDAGCGAGNVMLLASKIGFSVYGLELDPTIIAFAEKLKILPNCIIKQNILTYKMYGKFNVIYFYRPIANETKQAKFEKLVKDQMKIGAILIPIFKVDKSITRDKRFKRIHVEQRSYIYQKIAE